MTRGSDGAALLPRIHVDKGTFAVVIRALLEVAHGAREARGAGEDDELTGSEWPAACRRQDTVVRVVVGAVVVRSDGQAELDLAG